MKRIEETKIWNIVLKFERFVIILTSGICTLIIVLGVCLRYLFNSDLFGIEEFLIILAFWLYFTGAAYGSYKENHIRADILMVFFKNKKIIKAFRLIELSISAIVATVFTFWGFQYLLWGFQKGARSPGWRIPQVIPQSSIFFGFLLMSVYIFVHLIRTVKNKN
jgi:TRAP-type transport system small permease protein